MQVDRLPSVSSSLTASAPELLAWRSWREVAWPVARRPSRSTSVKLLVTSDALVESSASRRVRRVTSSLPVSLSRILRGGLRPREQGQRERDGRAAFRRPSLPPGAACSPA
jgi:hypothetical protein